MSPDTGQETEPLAAEALRLIEIEWEVLPFHLNTQAALEPDAYPIHPEINPKGNLLPADPRKPHENVEVEEEVSTADVFYQRNDIDRGFSESDVVVQWTSSHHDLDHACLDTMGCLMVWEGDRLICYTNSYQADQTRMMIAQTLELPLNKVRVICPYLGASMGRWNRGDQSFFLYTAILAKRAGRPVKYKHSRREDKGGDICGALVGENRYHSIMGAVRMNVVTMPFSSRPLELGKA